MIFKNVLTLKHPSFDLEIVSRVRRVFTSVPCAAERLTAEEIQSILADDLQVRNVKTSVVGSGFLSDFECTGTDRS